MAKASGGKAEPKTILAIVGVVFLVMIALWQGTKSLSSSASDPSFSAKKPAPPESARPPGAAPNVPSGTETDEKMGRD